MFNRPNQNDINDDAQDIRNDVSRLADTLEEVLKSGAPMRRTMRRPQNVRLSLCCVRNAPECMAALVPPGLPATWQVAPPPSFVKNRCVPGYGRGGGYFVGALLSLRK